jgi:hypothetical protein
VTPVAFEGSNRLLVAEGCTDLPAMVDGTGTVWTMWEPTADERAALAAGAMVVLGVVTGTGTQPPVMVLAQHPPVAS